MFKPAFSTFLLFHTSELSAQAIQVPWCLVLEENCSEPSHTAFSLSQINATLLTDCIATLDYLNRMLMQCYAYIKILTIAVVVCQILNRTKKFSIVLSETGPQVLSITQQDL